MKILADSFFKQLRLLLAVRTHRLALGNVVIEAIENIIIPKLEKAYRRATDFDEIEELENQISLWKKYADSSTPQGKVWNEDAAKVVSSTAWKFKVKDSDAEDIANTIASDFYMNPRLRGLFERFRIESGPLGLRKLFKVAVGHQAMDILRKMTYQQNRGVSMNAPSEEGGEFGDTIKDRSISELDKSEVEEVRQDMFRWLSRKLKGEVRELFLIWSRLTEDVDPSRINWSKDVYPLWVEVTGKSPTIMNRNKREMFQKIIEYLHKEADLIVTERTLKNLKLANVVAKRFWRKKFSAWMLAPYYDAMKLRGKQ